MGKNPSGRFVLGVEPNIAVAPALQATAALQAAAADVGPRRPATTAAGAGAGAAAAEPLSHGSDGGSNGGGGGWGITWSGSGGDGGAPSAAPIVERLRLIQSHGDQVLALPPGGVLLASSPSAPIEMWGWGWGLPTAAGGGNVLAVQGHAELSAEDTLAKIHSALSANGRLSPGGPRCAALAWRCGACGAYEQKKCAGMPIPPLPGLRLQRRRLRASAAFARTPPTPRLYCTCTAASWSEGWRQRRGRRKARLMIGASSSQQLPRLGKMQGRRQRRLQGSCRQLQRHRWTMARQLPPPTIETAAVGCWSRAAPLLRLQLD